MAPLEHFMEHAQPSEAHILWDILISLYYISNKFPGYTNYNSNLASNASIDINIIWQSWLWSAYVALTHWGRQ